MQAQSKEALVSRVGLHYPLSEALPANFWGDFQPIAEAVCGHSLCKRDLS